jgi:hypothetical protein
MAERVKALNGALALLKQPVTAADVAKGFARVKAVNVSEILETLCTMGHARRGQREGTFLCEIMGVSPDTRRSRKRKKGADLAIRVIRAIRD